MATITSLVPTEPALTPDYLPPVDPKAVEQAMLIGDLSQMSDAQRIAYYVAVCRSLHLNPLTKPFMALKDDSGKLTLYPDKGCAEQLRKRDRVSTRVVGREILDGLYIVTVEARTPDGRTEEAQGIVPLVKAKGHWETYDFRGEQRRRFKPDIGGDGQEVLIPLTPAERATAMKRSETQAKRRATLAICGLGLPEAEDAPDSPTHPQALRFAAPAAGEAGKDLAAHVADLYGDAFTSPTESPKEDVQQGRGATITPTPIPPATPDPEHLTVDSGASTEAWREALRSGAADLRTLLEAHRRLPKELASRAREVLRTVERLVEDPEATAVQGAEALQGVQAVGQEVAAQEELL